MTNHLREVVADALLPCPVCIGKGSVDRQHDADGMLWVYVSCNKCGLRTRGKWCSSGNDCPLFYREVRDEWNTRATLPTQSAGVEERALGFQAAVALEVGADQDDQDDILLHVRAWVASAKGQAAAIRTPASEGDGGRVCTCPSGDGSLRWPCPTHPPTQQEARAVVTDEMVERGLDAAIEATYARLARYSVVRAILTAALRTKQPAASEGDGRAMLRECYEWLFESKADGPQVSEGAIERGYYTPEFRDLHDRLRAAIDNTSKQAAGEAVPIGWFTDDHLTDRSATTYDKTVADRWVAKGWPITPIYTTPPRHPADEGAVYDSMVERAADAYESAAESEGFGRVDGSERVTHLRFIRAAIDAALLAKSAAYDALVARCSELAAKLDRQAEENYTDRGNALSRCADDIRLLVSDDRPSHTAGENDA